MKKSLVLLETVISIVLLSIIFFSTTQILLDIYKKNKLTFTTNLTKLEFESTKLFLITSLKKYDNLDNLEYNNNSLFFNHYLLQQNITNFNIQQTNNLYTINICINLDTNICQQWIIK